MLEHTTGDPLAYAILDDVADYEAAFLLKHEGIHVMRYEVTEESGHKGFDEYLEAIHKSTSWQNKLGELLSGKVILWVDKNPRNNELEALFIAKVTSKGTDIEQVVDRIDAFARLAERKFDLVISRWGHNEQGRAEGEDLLDGLRGINRDNQAPVIFFAAGGNNLLG